MIAYVITRTNDFYGGLEDVLLFSSKEKALAFLRKEKRTAEQNDALVDWQMAGSIAYVTFTDDDNMQYTDTLDVVPHKIY